MRAYITEKTNLQRAVRQDASERGEQRRRRVWNRRKLRRTGCLLLIVSFVCGLLLGLCWTNIAQSMENRRRAVEASGIAQTESALEERGVDDTPTEDWMLTLVNRTHTLTQDVSGALRTVSGNCMVDARIADALDRMLSDARAAGLSPMVCSGYRTIERQQALFDASLQKRLEGGMERDEALRLTERYVARPGSSEHHLGLAVDIVATYNQNLEEAEQAALPETIWLQKNCARYGFILRYPKEKEEVTGFLYEPWHYRYVGTQAALKMTAQNLTLEEYLGQ